MPINQIVSNYLLVPVDLRCKAVILDQSEGLDNMMASIANNDHFPLQAIKIKRRISRPFLAQHISFVQTRLCNALTFSRLVLMINPDSFIFERKT